MVVKVKQVVKYDGHSLSSNGSVNFKLRASYSELVNSIKLMQMLNNDVIIKAKVPGSRVMKLGIFRIKQIVFDGDGESKITFNGLNDFIEMDNLNLLPLKNSEETNEFQVLYESNVEDENVEDEENEE